VTSLTFCREVGTLNFIIDSRILKVLVVSPSVYRKVYDVGNDFFFLQKFHDPWQIICAVDTPLKNNNLQREAVSVVSFRKVKKQ